MSRADVLIPLAFLVTVAGIAVSFPARGLSLLPRHGATRDVPWSRLPSAEGLASQPLNQAVSDPFNLHLPDVAFYRKEVANGRLPRWNPWILGGVPHLANPLTATLYPPNVLLLLGSEPVDGLLAVCAFHVALAALALFAFLRVAGCDATAAALGAVAFALSGWVAAHAMNHQLVATVAWIPIQWTGVLLVARGARARGLWLLAGSTCASWLAGFPQFALLGSGSTALFALSWHSDPAEGARRASRWPTLVALSLGVALAAPQLLPTLELMPRAGHQGASPDAQVDQRFRPVGFVGLVASRALGDPLERAPWTSDLGTRILLGEPRDGGYSPAPVMNFGERALYLGFPLALLACVGLVFGGRLGRRAATVAVLGALLSSEPSVVRLLAHVPVLSVGAPARAVVLVALAASVLAACGWRAMSMRPTLRTTLAFLALVLGASMGGLALVGFVAPTDALDALISWVKSMGVEARFGAPSLAVETYRDPLRPWFERLRLDLLQASLALGASGVAWLGWTRLKGARWFVAVVALDLLVAFAAPNPGIARAHAFDWTPTLRTLRARGGDGRILRVSPTAERAVAEADSLFIPNLGVLFELSDTQGWREQVPRPWLDAFRDTAALVRDVGFSGIDASHADDPVLDVARVRFLLATDPIPRLENRRVPGTGVDGDLVAYERPTAWPRAVLVPQVIVASEWEGLEALRRGPASQLRERAYVDRWPEGWPRDGGNGSGTVTVLEDRPGSIRLSVTTDEPTLLLLTDAAYPGFRVRRAGPNSVTEDDALTVFGTFLGAAVPAGSWTIEVVYAGASLWIGFWVAGAALVGLAGFAHRMKTSS